MRRLTGVRLLALILMPQGNLEYRKEWSRVIPLTIQINTGNICTCSSGFVPHSRSLEMAWLRMSVLQSFVIRQQIEG